MRELRFKQHVKKAPTKSGKSSNVVRNARIRSFPVVAEKDIYKMDAMLEVLFMNNGKLYSELSLNEKRVVEFFCKRVEVTSSGATWKEGMDVEKFTILKGNSYAFAFASRIIGEYIPLPSAKQLTIFEDERMNPDELFGTPRVYTGSPFHDALEGYPTSYLPVRASKGKADVFAVFPAGSSHEHKHDTESYLFKERVSVILDEALYQNPYIPREEVEQPTKEEIITSEKHPHILKFESSIEINVARPSAVVTYDIYRENPEEFIKKYGELPEIPAGFLQQLEDGDRTSEDYKKIREEFV